MLRRIVRWAGLIVLAAGLWFLGRWYLRPEPLRVTTAVVERGAVESMVTNSRAGTVRARRRTSLSPEIGGTVVFIAHREGDRVRAGEVLIRLNDDHLRASCELAQREVELALARREQNQVALARAGRELRRYESLASDQIVSEDRLDELRSRHEELLTSDRALKATVERNQAALARAEAELRKAEIRAPFDGVVAELNVEEGEWATPSPPLLRAPPALDLIDLSSLYVSAPMDEVDCTRIQTGQDVKITVDSHRGSTFAGRVTRVAPHVIDVEQQNRTVEVEVDFADPEVARDFLPGTSADVEIVLEVRSDRLRIPVSALLEGSRVLVVNGDVLEERPVEVGLRNWDHAEILDGLEAGERVVTSLDRVEVEAGAKVEVEHGAEILP